MKITDLLNQISAYWVWIAAAAAVAIISVIIFRSRRPISKKVESKIRRRRYISQEQFFETWKADKKDFPGCYVILIYDRKLIMHPLRFDDIYIGQSVNVRHRVFSHLMGHGNGNVYYGLRSGCKVFVLIQKCPKKKLNRAEKELIAYFHATSSLNMTKGGAPRR